MKEFRKYFGGLERDFGFCNVNNGYHDPQTNKFHRSISNINEEKWK